MMDEYSRNCDSWHVLEMFQLLFVSLQHFYIIKFSYCFHCKHYTLSLHSRHHGHLVWSNASLWINGHCGNTVQLPYLQFYNQIQTESEEARYVAHSWYQIKANSHVCEYCGERFKTIHGLKLHLYRLRNSGSHVETNFCFKIPSYD